MNEQTLGSGNFYINLYLGKKGATPQLTRYLNAATEALGEFTASFKAQQVECCLTICGEEKIKNLNMKYRQKDSSTDVLSFALHQNPAKETNIPLINLGDIYICFAVAKNQAQKFNVSLEEEIIHLLVHGFLHLLGFDHERSTQDEKIMSEKELLLVDSISRKLKG